MLKQFADLKQTKSNKTETKDKNESDIVYRLSEFKETVLKKLRAAKDYTILLLELVNSLVIARTFQILEI
jgi:hypothetical protein